MRMAFSVIELDENEAREFADAIIEAKTRIHSCPICGNLTDEDIENLLVYYYVLQWNGELPETYIGTEDFYALLSSLATLCF